MPVATGISGGVTEPQEPGDPAELSVVELVSRLSEQISELVREELRLALAELKQKGKRAGTGAGLVGAAVIIAVLGMGALVVAVTSALARVLPLWAAALIVGCAMFMLSGLLGFIGAGEIKRGVQSMSEHAITSLARDVQTVKESAKR